MKRDLLTVEEILEEVRKISPLYFRPSPKLPEPHNGSYPTKAIVLGCDPGNDYKQNFDKVFGLENINSKYFASIVRNLESVTLNLNNIYVENVCRNYFSVSTYKHQADWKKCAEIWLPSLIESLDDFDMKRTIPVLVTSEIILKVLAINKCPKPMECYLKEMIFPKETNKLGRTIIPFYRHHHYCLQKWPSYTNRIYSLIHNA